ncbi:FAD-binding oxidoreductase [Jiangella rhizosphaerae]|uniref:FAD-binding oxidoreductase n=1 Tax=Jiangella rhizosphaerae TaxID=2293569 RepID=A0A418KT01_9ACTN|nr:FAD-binding oxidoreductase [Jiangella rhizosphaerae]RIQ28613.1 FAD-binding oxidoreductase [Jiangella rhizosphaerae]
MTSDSTLPTIADASAMRDSCEAVHLPGDPGYDMARMPWNVAFDQRPAAVAYPADAAEVASVVRAAAAAGLRVAPQGTGHNAGALAGDLSGVVLLRTGGMTGVTVDTDARTARVGAGALWLDAVEAAAPHGLATLHGSSPDVGIAGYSLGGGLGWYARELGLQANSVTAVELVTADGSRVRADAGHEAELFWALRGGGGNFGVVTALEFRLYPIPTAYAGMLVFDWTHAARALPRWAEWAAEAPDIVTTSFRILQLPPFPEIPEPVRGRQLVVINGAVLADDARAAAILEPLRELGPELDTFATVPSASLVRLHMDPEGPTPAVSDSSLLAGLPAAAVDAFLAAAGPDSGSSLLMAELRHLGGALSRPQPDAGALSMLDGQFLQFGVTIAATPEQAEQGAIEARDLVTAMSPYATGKRYLNVTETPADASTGYGEAAWRRLQAVRSAVDPGDLFVAGHRIPPA